MELLLGALRRFVAAHDGIGPLHGGLPDLATTTTTFQQLQNIYAVQAEADLAEMQTHLQALAEAAGPAAGNVAADARSQLKTFVRNLGALEVKSFPSIIAEYSPGFRLHAGSPARAPTPHEALYVALRAAERFQTTHKRWPAVFDDELPSDLAALVPLATSLAADLGLESSGVPELVQEVCRSGSAELHATGALLGGVAAQEAIKLITRQWVPLSALWVFNGIASTAAVLPLTP
jgi:amyloid beta precursor protein binding protein 1